MKHFGTQENFNALTLVALTPCKIFKLALLGGYGVLK